MSPFLDGSIVPWRHRETAPRRAPVWEALAAPVRNGHCRRSYDSAEAHREPGVPGDERSLGDQNLGVFSLGYDGLPYGND